MKLDYKKWNDIYSDVRDINTSASTKDGSTGIESSLFQNAPLLNSDGMLTDLAKDLMSIYEVSDLDSLLYAMEGNGDGYFYKNDTNRADINISGHQVFVDTYSADPDSQTGYSPSNREVDGRYEDILQNEEYITTGLTSSNAVTRRESKAKMARIEFYRNLNK